MPKVTGKVPGGSGELRHAQARSVAPTAVLGKHMTEDEVMG
jgi:hypothetical protein